MESGLVNTNKENEDKNNKYKGWKEILAQKFIKKIAIHPDDLRDYNYREMYELGYSTDNILNIYLTTITDDEIYYYWLRYIQNEYYKHYKTALKDSNMLKQMFLRRVPCYDVFEGLKY